MRDQPDDYDPTEADVDMVVEQATGKPVKPANLAAGTASMRERIAQLEAEKTKLLNRIVPRPSDGRGWHEVTGEGCPKPDEGRQGRTNFNEGQGEESRGKAKAKAQATVIWNRLIFAS